MIPRLTTSNKWTALPTELCEQIRDVFNENFAHLVKEGKLIVEGRIYAEELLLRVGYLEAGRLRQANFEVSLDFNPNKQNAMTQIHIAVDVAASLMSEYFESEQNLKDFPIEWSPIEIEKTKAYIQITTVNTDLEAEASKLLGEEFAEEDDGTLVNLDDEVEVEDEKKAVITMLGINDLDSDDFEAPENDKDYVTDEDGGDDENDGGDDDQSAKKQTQKQKPATSKKVKKTPLRPKKQLH